MNSKTGTKFLLWLGFYPELLSPQTCCNNLLYIVILVYIKLIIIYIPRLWNSLPPIDIHLLISTIKKKLRGKIETSS